MTHTASITGNRRGLEPTSCAGLLVCQDLHPADGDTVIAVYECDGCGWTVVVAHPPDDRWHAVNHYPGPAALAAKLAATLSYRDRKGLDR